MIRSEISKGGFWRGLTFVQAVDLHNRHDYQE